MVNPKVPSWLPSTSPAVGIILPAPSFSRSQPAVSPSEMKQMSWLSGLFATDRPRRSASSDLRLPGVAEREERVRELLLGEHAEHVGLVLAHVDRAVHLDQAVVPVTSRA